MEHMSGWLKLIKALYFMENSPCEARTINSLIHIKCLTHISAEQTWTETGRVHLLGQ